MVLEGVEEEEEGAEEVEGEEVEEVVLAVEMTEEEQGNFGFNINSKYLENVTKKFSKQR